LAVLLAGLTLGWRDGALSQATYLGLIAMGAPLAANGVGGWVAFNSPTTGYLLSFPLAAAVTGALAVRPVLAVRWLAGVVGVVVVYLCGTTWLKQYLGLSWSATWEAGVEPFIAFDMAKALLAAASGEGARWLRRAFLPPQQD
jgi:biotin transport system substrate-specific component